MSLKIFTSACLLAGVLVFFLGARMVVDHPSRDAPIQVRKEYAEKLIMLSAAEMLAMVSAGVGALVIYRRARNDYAEEIMQNMKGLVEAVQKDQIKSDHE